MSEASARERFFVALIQTIIVFWATCDLLIDRNLLGLLLLIIVVRNGKIAGENWEEWRGGSYGS